MNNQAPWGGGNQLYLQALQNVVQAINALNSPLSAVVNKISGLSVLGNSGTVTAVAAAIIGTADQVLCVNTAGNLLRFAQIATGGITNSAVTYVKIQNEAATSLLGNPTGAPAAPSEVTLATALAFSGTTLDVAAGGITLAKMANLAANSVIGNNTGSPATPIALTQAQFTAMINSFTSTLAGDVPASGGGTTNFLRADGTWAAPPSATISPTVQLQTGTQTVTIPTNATKLKVTLIGGGGGGAGTATPTTNTNVGGSGGGGAACIKYLSGLTAGNTLALTVGGAGSGGAAGANNGGNGGDTTLASGTQVITTLTAGGGVGGATPGSAAGPDTSGGASGAGGTATNGDLNINGGSGLSIILGTAFSFNIGGAAALGFGPALNITVDSGSAASVAGTNATRFGAGGTGATSRTTGAAQAGGNGSAGCAIFEWYA
jgi:hypothetical protein